MNSLFIGILMREALNVNAMSTCRKMIPTDWSPFFVAAYTSAAPSHIPQILNIYIYFLYIYIYIYILSRWTFISTTVNYITVDLACSSLESIHLQAPKTRKKTGQPHHPESCCKSRLKLCPARGRCFSCTFQWWPRSLESWWGEIRWWFLLLITLSLILPLSLPVSIIIIIS